jgi:hypothetical protein
MEHTAIDKEKELILKVINWCHDCGVRPSLGYWEKDFSSIAYTDEKIVEEFMLNQINKTIE